MSQAQRPPAGRISDGAAASVARMCADLADAAELVGPNCEPVLARLRVEDATEDRVRAALDELEEILRRRGLVGVAGVGRGGDTHVFRALPGVGSGRSLEEVHMCPGNLCDRVEIPRPGPAKTPMCSVWACPLPLVRLSR